MDVRSRRNNSIQYRQNSMKGNKSKYDIKKSCDIEKNITKQKKKHKHRSSKQHQETSYSAFSAICSRTVLLGLIATFSLVTVQAVFALKFFLSLTEVQSELQDKFQVVPDFAGSAIRAKSRTNDKIHEEEDMDMEEEYLSRLSKQQYLGEALLPWENPLILELRAKFATTEVSTEPQVSKLEQSEQWLSSKLLAWLKSGQLDFDSFARGQISEAKEKNLGQDALSDDLKTILSGRKVLEDHSQRFSDLVKKQLLIENRLKQLFSEDGQPKLGSFQYIDHTVDVIIPEVIRHGSD